ncbi:hypothetical protein MWU76_09730 [Gelidibacter sp. F2691]|nr:hypothetical protein [Gelidibacter sp. F2691]
MKRVLSVVVIFVTFTFASTAQINLNEELKREIWKINEDDQNLRKIYFVQEVYDLKSDSLKKEYGVDDVELKKILVEKIKNYDSLNLIKIESIIKEHGYPGKSLVGHNESGVVWQVIQHSTPIIMRKYLDVLKKAADEGEIEFTKYALTFDRILVSENKPQIYGSQAKKVKLLGSNEYQLIIWPIADSKSVNKLRRKAGFKESIKKYAKNMGIAYKPHLIEDLQ